MLESGRNQCHQIVGHCSCITKGLVIYNDQIYGANRDSKKIYRSNLNGSNIIIGDGPNDLTIHNEMIYWTNEHSDKIQRSNLDGTNVPDLVIDLDGSNITSVADSSNGIDNPNGLIIHNDQIYWTTKSNGKTQQSNLDRSNVPNLLSEWGWPSDLTIQNNQIYWTDHRTGKIQRADLNLAGPEDEITDFTLQVGANNTAENNMTFGIDYVTTDSLVLADTGVGTLVDVQTTINALDSAIDFINDQHSNLGAVPNRLEFAHSNLMSSIQNTASSISTIQDADFAVEASNLARTQILTQSGTAMLAQANQISQNILSLLK